MAEARGSTKVLSRLFDSDPSDRELQEALRVAREEYRVLRWWKYGQPAPDVIKAKLDVPPDRVGEVLTDLVQQQGNGLQVTLDVFPYGVPAFEGLVVDVTMERAVGG
jgi:hypothetical protein